MKVEILMICRVECKLDSNCCCNNSSRVLIFCIFFWKFIFWSLNLDFDGLNVFFLKIETSTSIHIASFSYLIFFWYLWYLCSLTKSLRSKKKKTNLYQFFYILGIEFLLVCF